MNNIKTLLVANRGEIAVRIIKTAKRHKIHTVAIYTSSDASSTHVSSADNSILLSGPETKEYSDIKQIIEIAKKHNVNAVIPGYGFLSENAEFARAVAKAGMIFVGPSPECIEQFGVKHTARDLAAKANVPIVPGSKGLVGDENEAATEADRLGYPVMLKATAGGGGMGLITCMDEEELRKSFSTVQSRGEALFKDSGLFVEKFYTDSHHIEVQVFGNAIGNAIHFGERECSIQRRHQKVIEECPSPFVVETPELREKLGTAAIRLAESIRYGSAGTVEFLVDDESKKFFFLEMNTRLQVEHGITELCYDVDLVELMLKQADAEIQGKGGLDADYLATLQPSAPKGVAIEARVYAENPVKNYAPSPGLLQSVEWKEVDGCRIDTWVHTGSKISSNFDPLIAKTMVHSSTRDTTITRLKKLLKEFKICGPPTNMDFLAAILDDETFKNGRTMTKFLSTFDYRPAAIDILQGGAYTLVEDWPGRPTIGRGFSHSGPMDPLAFRSANALVGNEPGVEGLEITLSGPDLRFLGAAIVALCGAPIEAKLEGNDFPMWTRVKIQAGQRLTIGKTTGGGCRAYLAIYGGLPGIATWFGSKSTAPMTAVGGYQGRALAAGDLLDIVKETPDFDDILRLPSELIPSYPEEWDLFAMPGPYDVGFLTEDFIETMYDSTWTISHNAARGGIRLLGPKPKWAREDGGEGGAHPSNVIEYGYPIGTLNWTGDDPCLFPIDAPDFGGFVSAVTIIKADYWRLGQMKAGNKLRLHRISYEEALEKREVVESFLSQVQEACKVSEFSNLKPLTYDSVTSLKRSNEAAIIHQIEENGIQQPLATYRQGGDDFLLIDYGHGSFDLNYRCRAVALYRKLKEAEGEVAFRSGALLTGMACGNSLMLYFDSTKLPRKKLLDNLVKLEDEIGDLSEAKFPSRKYRLPITFSSQRQRSSIQRYIETQRPYASYLPDPLEFVAQNNAFTTSQLKKIFTESSLMVVAVGFFIALPIALPIDPRQRLQCPKMNPSRVHTPEGQVGWGGSCMALYNVESPGGYMNLGLSIPGADVLGFKHGYSENKPWLFEDFDQITFYEVSEDRYEEMMEIFRSGTYHYEYEDGEFDMKEHNELLRSTKDEVDDIRKKQKDAQRDMDKLEKKLLEKWSKEKEGGKISMDTVEELMNDPDIIVIEAPLNANVWKVEVKEGDKIKDGQVVSILEAMKLEIPVKAEQSMVGSQVEKILIKPNDVVDAGNALILLRKLKV